MRQLCGSCWCGEPCGGFSSEGNKSSNISREATKGTMWRSELFEASLLNLPVAGVLGRERLKVCQYQIIGKSN